MPQRPLEQRATGRAIGARKTSAAAPKVTMTPMHCSAKSLYMFSRVKNISRMLAVGSDPLTAAIMKILITMTPVTAATMTARTQNRS